MAGVARQVSPLPAGAAVPAWLAANAYRIYLALVAVVMGAIGAVDVPEVVVSSTLWAGPAAVVAGIALHRPIRRWPWVALACGMALFTLGDVVAAILGPFQTWSVVDVFYVPAYLLIAAWLVALNWKRTPSALLIDAMVITASIVTIMLSGVGGPYLAAAGMQVPTTMVLYPVVGAGLVVGALALALACGFRKYPSTALVVGMGALFCADVVWAAEVTVGLYAPRETLVVLWGLLYAAVGSIALHPMMARFGELPSRAVARLSRRRFALLTSAALAVPVAALVLPFEPPWIVPGALLVIMLLVAARVSGVVAELARTATVDVLTDLPNRASLEDRLQRILSRVGPERSDRHRLVVLFCDLDQFKIVNDGLGHAVGDHVLMTMADRLQRSVRAHDVVSRVGGDEFVVLMPDIAGDEIDAIVDRMLAAVAEPVSLPDGSELRQTMSVGVAVATPNADAQSLLRDADAAMYRAKEDGRARAVHFAPSLHIDARQRLELASELQPALDKAEIYCVFQPEITASERRIVGIEALARWWHPHRGVLMPRDFIDLAESSDLINQVFRRVLALACAQQVELARNLPVDPFVAVNLSARQLHDEHLVAAVAEQLELHNMTPELLWLEVTETALAPHLAQSLGVLADLRAMGVKVVIDDFGTGWSTLSRLADGPWDVLKIDQRFVTSVTDSAGHAIVKASIAMARSLGMVTVAEGVETREQFLRLEALGCDIAQGHYVAAPTSIATIMARVDAAGRWLGLGDAS